MAPLEVGVMVNDPNARMSAALEELARNAPEPSVPRTSVRVVDCYIIGVGGHHGAFEISSDRVNIDSQFIMPLGHPRAFEVITLAGPQRGRWRRVLVWLAGWLLRRAA